MYRMRIVASDPVGPDPQFDQNVFVYRRRPASPYHDTPIDDCIALLSPADFGVIPIGEPDPSQAHPFFRLSEAVWDFRTQKLADKVWAAVQRDLVSFLAALNAFQTLEPLEQICLTGTHGLSCQEQLSVSDSGSDAESESP